MLNYRLGTEKLGIKLFIPESSSCSDFHPDKAAARVSEAVWRLCSRPAGDQTCLCFTSPPSGFPWITGSACGGSTAPYLHICTENLPPDTLRLSRPAGRWVEQRTGSPARHRGLLSPLTLGLGERVCGSAPLANEFQRGDREGIEAPIPSETSRSTLAPVTLLENIARSGVLLLARLGSA
ncbi:hypothetical protein AOLI_G00244520 [Acnodon oligacanthus]